MFGPANISGALEGPDTCPPPVTPLYPPKIAGLRAVMLRNSALSPKSRFIHREDSARRFRGSVSLQNTREAEMQPVSVIQDTPSFFDFWRHCCTSICCCFLVLTYFAGDLKGQVEVRRVDHEPAPSHRIDPQAFEDIVGIGLDVAATYYPQAKGVKLACDCIDIVADAAGDAIDHRTTVQQGDFLLIDRDAQRLRQLKSEGRTLSNDDEAAEIRNRLVQRLQNDSSYVFAGKALADPYALYALAKYGSTKYASKLVGNGVVRLLGVGESTRLAFLGEGRIRNQLTRTQWGYLKQLAKFAQELSDKLADALIAKLAENLTLKQLGKELDTRVDEIMSRVRASSVRGGTGRGFGDLRLDAVSDPSIFLPVLLPKTLKISDPKSGPQLREAQPRIEPSQRLVIRTYEDPVLRTVAVQSQIRSYAAAASDPTWTQTWTPPPDFSHNISINLSSYENFSWY